jgi:hypothetical protein
MAAMMDGMLSRRLHTSERERSPESITPTDLSS